MIDQQRILDVIVSSPYSATAKEAGAELVDAWVSQHYERDSLLKVLAVEMGFHIWLDEKTLIVGVQDAVFQDLDGVLGGEWKSAKEPKRNKDGSDSAYWNEEVWLKELINGPQLGVYALALNRGTYFEMNPTDPDNPNVHQFRVDNPRIMVRAAVKSSPPRFWPSDGGGVFRFPNEMLVSVENALRQKAHQIRCARKLGLVPWQLPGKHCQNRFNKEMCPFFESWCDRRVHPQDDMKNGARFDPNDPAFQLAVRFVDEKKLADKELVILSASAYSAASECLEKHRILALATGEKESSLALDTGSVMHGGLAEFYRQLKEGL